MFKLVLGKAEEPEIRLPTSAGSLKEQEFQKNIYFCFTDYAKAFDCVKFSSVAQSCLTLCDPMDCKSVLNIHWEDWCWSWNSNTLATWCEELTHLKRPWSWERLKAGGEGDDRGWDGWMASLTQWTWDWVNSRNWWWIGKPSVLQSMGLQSLTWLRNWTELMRINTEFNHIILRGTERKIQWYAKRRL